MVDAAGTTAYGYAAGGQLRTEDGPWSSDTVTNFYWNRMRTNLSLAQPTGKWTNGFAYDAAKRLTNVTSPAGAQQGCLLRWATAELLRSLRQQTEKRRSHSQGHAAFGEL